MQPLKERRQRLQSVKTNIRATSSTQGQAIRLLRAVNQRAEKRRADELVGMVKALKRKKSSSQIENPLFHTVIIKPVGNRCNLRCSYCFTSMDKALEGHAALPVMGEEILRIAITQALAAGPERLHFVWHGGEPLLAGIRFFETAVWFQQELNGKSKTIENSVQTNGTLMNDQWISLFQRNKFGVSISLDGPEAIHDRYRRYPSGEGSFHHVQKTIQRLQAHGMDIGVLTVITPHMTITPQELFFTFLSQNIRNFAISPCCLPGDLAISPEDYADFSIGLFDVWLAEGSTSVQINPFEDIVSGLLGYSPRLCWMRGTCTMFICIEPNGDVWPCCERALPSESYRWGNIMDMDLSTIHQSCNAHDFLSADQKRQSSCMTCRWAFLCRGGCVYNRIIGGGSAGARDHLCSAYHRIFAHMAGRIDEILLRM